MLNRYLEELAASAGRELSSVETQALVAETHAHLEDSIQARLELGLTPEEAEREAIAAFGARREIIAGLEGVRQVRFVRKRLWSVAGVTFVLLASTVLFSVTDWVWLAVLPFLAVGIGVLFISVLGFAARRPAPIPLALSGIGSSLACWGFMSMAYLNLWSYGGVGYLPRWGAATALAEAQDHLSTPSRSWTVRDERGRVTESGWNRYDPESDRSVLVAIPEAQADPLGNALSQSGGAFSSGMMLAGVAVVFDLVGAGLGFLWAGRRSRRDGGLRA